MEQTSDTQTKLATTLKNLPTKPGVYIMKDQTGKVIYVGKAINLRNRVRSYFQSPDGQPQDTPPGGSHRGPGIYRHRLRAGSPDPGMHPDQEAPALLQRPPAR